MASKVVKNIGFEELVFTIEELLFIVEPVLKRHTGSEISFPIEHTFLIILERAESNLFSLKYLLADDTLKHDHAIGLISRNLLSDFFLCSYLFKSSIGAVENELYKLHYADLKKVDSLVTLYSKHGAISEEEFLSYEKERTENIAGIIRRVIVERELKDAFPNNREIIEQMLKKKDNDAWALEIIRAYPVWTFFSKYEHFGWNSYQLTRNKTNVEMVRRLNDVIRMSSIMIGGCFETLKEKEAMGQAVNIMTTLVQKYLDGQNDPRRSL